MLTRISMMFNVRPTKEWPWLDAGLQAASSSPANRTRAVATGGQMMCMPKFTKRAAEQIARLEEFHTRDLPPGKYMSCVGAFLRNLPNLPNLPNLKIGKGAERAERSETPKRAREAPDQTYSTFTISSSSTPAGVRIFTTSPSSARSSALAMGEIQLTWPLSRSTSSTPTILTVRSSSRRVGVGHGGAEEHLVGLGALGRRRPPRHWPAAC